MSKQEVAKTLYQVAELLLFEEDEKCSFNYELGVLYESIRRYHIDIAIKKNNIEETFDLIFTPGKYYNKIHKNNDDIYCKLWKHYGYEFHPGNHNNTATEIPTPPSFTPLFLNCVLFGDYTPIETTFKEWYIDESLRGKIDKLIDLIKDKIPKQEKLVEINTEKSTAVQVQECPYAKKLADPEIVIYKNIKIQKTIVDAFFDRIVNAGGFSKCPTCKNIPTVYKICQPKSHLIEFAIPQGNFWKLNPEQIHSIQCCEHLYDFRNKKRYISQAKYLGPIDMTKRKEFNMSDTHTVFYVEYNPEDPYGEKAKTEQESNGKLIESEDPHCEKTKLSPPVQPSPKVIKVQKTKEENFWDDVISNGGFSECPTCKNKPKVYTIFQHCGLVGGYKSTLTHRDPCGLNDEQIYSIQCCEHLYDFPSKKRYVICELGIPWSPKIKSFINPNFKNAKLSAGGFVIKDAEGPYSICYIEYDPGTQTK